MKIQSTSRCNVYLIAEDVVPPVEEVSSMSTGADSVLVTWQPPEEEDVTSFLVTWTETGGTHVNYDHGTNSGHQVAAARPSGRLSPASLAMVQQVIL